LKKKKSRKNLLTISANWTPCPDQGVEEPLERKTSIHNLSGKPDFGGSEGKSLDEREPSKKQRQNEDIKTRWRGYFYERIAPQLR